MRHIISILMENEPGALAAVGSLCPARLQHRNLNSGTDRTEPNLHRV